ncbi:hypothetical protein P8452_77205 [Trifolium repens]|nr:hypothetical protein QL285_095228 [Trifolium repens]WJX95942.1 hypothetical protein P8452_77205 [Trifolium repens]
MKPSCVLVSLLILSLILTKAQGIRLGKESLTFKQQKQHVGEATLCNDQEQCTGNIKNRKLVTTTISTTKSLSKNVKNREDVAHTSVNGNTRNVNGNGEAKDIKVKSLSTTSKYLPEDFVDITEMDYSPARKKSPIHN